MKKILVVLILLIPLIGEGSMTNVQEFYLDNGLKVLLVERNILPIVSIQLWYKVGAIDEVDGKSGLAHLLEHMSFKGTKSLKPGEFSRIIKSMGGEDNAATSWDYTMYYANIPSEYTLKVLSMMKEMMFDLVIDPKEFESEKKVVLEERRMRYEDDPIGQLFEEFLSRTFKRINYRRPIIGLENDIKNLSIEDVKNFYNTYYSPKNAVLVVVGNIDSTKIREEIKRIFDEKSKNQYQKKLEIENILEYNEGKVEFSTKRKDSNTKAVIVGFKTPSYLSSPNEVAALEVLSYILADGRNSRLYKELVVEKKVAASVNGGTLIGKYPFITYFLAIPTPNTDIVKLKEELINSINSIVNSSITEEELNIAKKKIKADKVFDFEKNKGIAGTLGWSEVMLGNYKEFDNFINLCEKTTKEDIEKVFKKYLTEENSSIGILEN
ncbi:MAG: M16 family metallopeptidase [Brevinematia bacterium]